MDKIEAFSSLEQITKNYNHIFNNCNETVVFDGKNENFTYYSPPLPVICFLWFQLPTVNTVRKY